MTRLLLVRHAESEWNALGRWQGWGDPGLSPSGRAQSEEAAGTLVGFKGRVVSSDLRRARETAEIMCAALRLGEPLLDERLREIDVGAWTGLTRDEIEQRFPGQLQAWRDRTLLAAPGGEDRDAFRQRVLSSIGAIAAGFPHDEVLVVTHSGGIHEVERQLGAYDGSRLANLSGRWVEAASPLRVAGERVELVRAGSQ